jgi:hypothetical protein
MKTEWLGGRYAVPDAIGQQLTLWLELPRGVIVASTISSADAPVSFAASFEDAMQSPLEGPPRRPPRIRVSDDRLAAELRAAAGGIPIEVAPVPELDAAFEAIVEALRQSGPENSYLAGGTIPPPVVADFFEAATLLFHAAPWERAMDGQIVRVDVPQFGVDRACLSVVGAAGEECGLLLFSSIDDYRSFARGEAPGAAEERVTLRSVAFTTRDDLSETMLREIEQYRWPVAAADAFPVALRVEGRTGVAVSEEDLRMLAAVTRAFVSFYRRHGDAFASDRTDPVRESIQDDDGVEVTLTAPYD